MREGKKRGIFSGVDTERGSCGKGIEIAETGEKEYPNHYDLNSSRAIICDILPHLVEALERSPFPFFPALESTIFKMSLPSSSSVAAHGRYTAASPNGQRHGVYSRPDCQPDAPTKSVPDTRNFTLELTPEPRIFTLDALQSSPIFTLPWHVPTNIWGECPPPPPTPPPGD